jgi:mono/diheme cytochrome c family protein
MNRIIPIVAVSFMALAGMSYAYAAKMVEEIEIEGMISPASPKALKEALEKQLAVKVVDYNFYGTPSGWPTVKVEYDSGKVSKDQIEKVINSTKDPTGRTYKVHKPVEIHLALLEEETKADSMLGPGAENPDIPPATNPSAGSAESTARGEKLFVKYCSKCHGLTGSGAGPSAHGFSTHPRQLWAWHNADASADPYLYYFITNGRGDMPPWGVILSDQQRWDLVNYVKTLEPPKQ